MGLLSDIFNQQKQIAQNPTQAFRTPQQQAYDNLLNRQYDIEQQNKKYNTVNGLMSGMGGLGKIIASAFVKDPYQQAGAMQGLSEQEKRTDILRQAYENARQQQNKDYVQQAKEQLDLANAEDERNYNRELTKNQIAYQQAKDKIAQQNTDRDYELKKSIADANSNKINAEIGKLNAEIKASNNKPAELTPEEKIALKVKEEDAIAQAKAKREAQQEANKAKADYEAFKSNINNLKALSKASGNTITRAFGGVGSIFDSLTGKGGSLTKPNVAMDELLAQLRQSALSASGISGESDDKAQQAKINDIYQRAGIPKNAKTLSPTQVEGIINNIENIYKQRLAGKENLVNSFNDKEEEIASNNDFSVSWGENANSKY